VAVSADACPRHDPGTSGSLSSPPNVSSIARWAAAHGSATSLATVSTREGDSVAPSRAASSSSSRDVVELAETSRDQSTAPRSTQMTRARSLPLPRRITQCLESHGAPSRQVPGRTVGIVLYARWRRRRRSSRERQPDRGSARTGHPGARRRSSSAGSSVRWRRQ